MASAALTGEQRAGSMGLPCEKDAEDQPEQVNHKNTGGVTQDSDGEALGSSEPQETPKKGMSPNLP